MLPTGWSSRESSSRPGVTYYVNNLTGETQWDLPTGPAQPKDVQQVRVRHILRKHKDSRRPASWRVAHITQSKQAAIDEIVVFRRQLEKCLEEEGLEAMEALFADVARSESDCGSAQKGGDLGFFGPGQMQKPFEEASFALGVGGLSGIVDTDSGIHIILRIA